MVTMIVRSAVVSDCGRYRYILRRVLAGGTTDSPPVVWVLCNPSTADGTQDDPTVRKCAGFTERMGFKRFDIVNPFAFRATQPQALLAAGCDVAGIDNWKWIEHAVTQPGARVIVGWGQAVPKALRSRLDPVVASIRAVHERPIYCFGLTDEWMPRHPLMLNYSTQLERY